MKKTETLGAFTLIELLIVITIISIIGISSLSGFSHMLSTQDMETTTKVISNTLDSFDHAIARHQITSYETIFKSGSLGFKTDLDFYKQITPVEYTFDFISWTGIAISTDTSTGMWELNFSTYDAPQKTYTVSASGGSQVFSFPQDIQKRWYKILSWIGDRDLNSCEIQYYNLTNVKKAPESEVYLVKIVGWNNREYTSLTVRNILGRKTLQGYWVTSDSLEKVILTFEKNGQEAEMIISL